jgi:hypothetical protein
MSIFRCFLVAGVGAGLALGTASQGFAFAAQSSTQAIAAMPAIYTVSQSTVKLSPIVVNGRRLVFPLFLQMVKTGLHQPWSGKWADRNQLVCRFEYMLGSHFKTLRCATNGEHFKIQDETQLALMTPAGQLPVSIANYTTRHWINQGAMMKLLKKLPPPGSSYTLRIIAHGGPVVDYVIEDGELTTIHRYISKGKKKKD